MPYLCVVKFSWITFLVLESNLQKKEDADTPSQVGTSESPRSSQPARWPELMTADAAAEYYSISPRKFRELVSSGLVTPRKVGPRCIRYSKRELDEAVTRLERGKGSKPLM